MSESHIKLNSQEKITLVARLEALSDDKTIELEAVLKQLKEVTLSEPGCVAFRIFRFGRLFLAFEECVAHCFLVRISGSHLFPSLSLYTVYRFKDREAFQ
ncbi:hypothetical protein FRB95_005720 [Tulasnella sp. JGI-2019a]|nr:hypothetical protein FRB95_005720 [Tulasnella sp. JGI-2019a]